MPRVLYRGGCVTQGFLDVLGDQVRKGGQDLVDRHPVADHLDNRGDGDSETPKARLATALMRSRGDAAEFHGSLAPTGRRLRLSPLRRLLEPSQVLATGRDEAVNVALDSYDFVLGDLDEVRVVG